MTPSKSNRNELMDKIPKVDSMQFSSMNQSAIGRVHCNCCGFVDLWWTLDVINWKRMLNHVIYRHYFVLLVALSGTSALPFWLTGKTLNWNLNQMQSWIKLSDFSPQKQIKSDNFLSISSSNAHKYQIWP